MGKDSALRDWEIPKAIHIEKEPWTDVNRKMTGALEIMSYVLILYQNLTNLLVRRSTEHIVEL